MLLKRNTPATGICFAWLPVQTPEGKVWLEHVHFEWQDHGFGGWSYERISPAENCFAADVRGVAQPPKTWMGWWLSLTNEERIRLRNEIADETIAKYPPRD